MNKYMLTEMTWEEVRDALKTAKLAVVPIGAHEQHGPHMVESCDAVLAEKMAEKLSEKLFPYALVTPTINFGVSQHHLNFPGTISLRPTTLITLLEDIITSLKHHGIKKFLLLNAHGGNQAALNIASTTLSADLNVEVYYAKTTASAKNVISKHITSSLFGHSCEREVSEAMVLAPELIRFNKLTKGDIQEGNWKNLRPGSPIQGSYQYEDMTANGCIGDATKASEELGKLIVEEALENLTNAMKSFLEIDVKLV
ncbi:creatininase family protein [Bacillus taeanensis]|uniref:Creatininase family protein n=1 Tax=Bacillus taeanensis TaxID=273032 RepID=A0A366Y0U1_9BACI|nr:creatininase family protein [Bacillus taeanensis]RBW70975.1 creatininase family protein [Bacillus taeanensis]